jgi:hypothetical protein
MTDDEGGNFFLGLAIALLIELGAAGIAGVLWMLWGWL